MSSVSKNIFWLSFSRILAIVLLALAYLFLFRYLGTYGTGQHQFVLSFVTIFGIIIDFGVQQYIIKKMSEEPNRQKEYFHNFLAIEVVLVCIVYTVLATVAYLSKFEPVVFKAILVSGIGTASIGLTYPFLAVMSANADLKKVALINFLNSFINASFIFTAIIFHKYIVFIVFGQLVFGLTAFTLYYQFVKKHIGEPQIFSAFKVFKWEIVKPILYASLPFALLVGFSTIYNRIDTVLIYKFLGPDQTGLYSSAYRLFDLIGFFPAVVSFSLYPIFAGLMARNALGEVRSVIEKYFRFMVAIALPVGVGGSLLALQIISVLAGKNFISAAPVLAILVWAPTFLIIYVVANSLVISQLTKFAVIITSVNMVFNVTANLIFLPIYGIKAAALITVISEAIQAIFYIYFIQTKITKFKVVNFLWQPIIASVIMGTAIYFVRDYKLSVFSNGSLLASLGELIWLVLIGAVVYIVALGLLRFFKSEDLKFVKSFLFPVKS